MGVLREFATWFKDQDVPIREWYSDDTGNYAFRVNVENTTFVAAARKNPPEKNNVSCFRQIPMYARDRDGYVLLLIKESDGPVVTGGMRVFDPEKILADGTDSSEKYDATRARRGERWVEFERVWGVPLMDFLEGYREPTQPTGLDNFT